VGRVGVGVEHHRDQPDGRQRDWNHWSQMFD
jgi:hypothetical protein